MRKRICIPALLITLLVLSISCSTVAQQSVLAVRATKVVDGSIADWSLPLRYYDKESHLQYAFANDDSMLYICLRITEAQYQMKLMKGGMSIVIDTTGKKGQDVSISCPIPESIASMGNFKNEADPKLDGSEPESNSDRMQNRVKEDLPLAFSLYTLKGFKKDGTFKTTKDTQDVKVVTAFTDFNALIIEYAIRINSFYKPLQPSDAAQKIALSFVINGMEQPKEGDHPHVGMSGMGGMGGMHGGMGGAGGGGMGGGGGRPPMGDGGPSGKHPGGMDDKSISKTTTTKVKLMFNVGQEIKD